jgi:hypothetical protein
MSNCFGITADILSGQLVPALAAVAYGDFSGNRPVSTACTRDGRLKSGVPANSDEFSSVSKNEVAMDNQRVYELGQRLKAIYRERLDGDPDELIRIWDDGVWYYVLRNDDTQAVFPIRYLAENREADVVDALRQFKPVD